MEGISLRKKSETESSDSTTEDESIGKVNDVTTQLEPNDSGDSKLKAKRQDKSAHKTHLFQSDQPNLSEFVNALVENLEIADQKQLGVCQDLINKFEPDFTKLPETPKIIRIKPATKIIQSQDCSVSKQKSVKMKPVSKPRKQTVNYINDDDEIIILD